MDPDELFWRGRSAFSTEGPPPAPEHPFAFVAGTTGAGAASGPSPPAPAARPAFGSCGGPDLTVPVALDATSVGTGQPKLWLALVRAAAAAGCGLVVTPEQIAARADVFRAARTVTFVSLAPGAATPPAAARAGSAFLLRLASPEGAPAVLEPRAFPGWVEAARALGAYDVPVAACIPPGRRPPWWALNEARDAGLAAIAFEEGHGHGREPLAARVGRAAQAAAAGGELAVLLGANDAPDGPSLATLLAAGARTVVTAGPVGAAVRHESASGGDWKGHGDALARALGVVWDDAHRIASMVGCADPRDLARDNLRALTYDAAALSGARLAGFDERLPWWVH